MLQNEYITKKELATQLHVSERTIERWIRTGRLPVTRIGRLVRINAEEARRIIDGGDAA